MKSIGSEQSGFTLIEMLMVISIISTLGLLGFSTYRKATFSAKNTRKVVSIKDITTSINAYVIGNDLLPSALETTRSGGATFIGCVGTTTRDINNNGRSDCDLTTAPYEEDASLNTAIATINKSIPLVDDTGVDFGGSGAFWGATLVYFDSSSTVTLNGVQRRMWLNYTLHGANQTCESLGGEVANGGTSPAWTSSSPTNTGLQVNGNTVCYVAITQEFSR